jgi:hypothetical protein
MDRDIALQKLQALAAGAALARKRYGKAERAVGWGSGRLQNRGQSPNSRKTSRKGRS